jgi:16S rRNA (cytidine1402-2'-O)-methyltransferase
MVSYFEHNKAERGPEIIERLKSGETCALVTDAGMPAISDPGEDLVKLCAQNGITATTVPGPCAAITALTLSGLATSRFTFEGFLPATKSERRSTLHELMDEKRTMIFHEAPHKLRATLTDMASIFGDNRQIAICRELTKLNEEILRLTLGGAIEYYSEKDPRGEYVLIVAGRDKTAEIHSLNEDMTIREQVTYYIESGMSKNDAIKATAKDRKLPKNDVYQEVIDLKI